MKLSKETMSRRLDAIMAFTPMEIMRAVTESPPNAVPVHTGWTVIEFASGGYDEDKVCRLDFELAYHRYLRGLK